MGRLKDALGKLTATHILLFLIAVGLAMNWWEMRGINKALTSTAKQVQFIEGDLTNIEGDVSDIEGDVKDIEIDVSP